MKKLLLVLVLASLGSSSFAHAFFKLGAEHPFMECSNATPSRAFTLVKLSTIDGSPGDGDMLARTDGLREAVDRDVDVGERGAVGLGAGFVEERRRGRGIGDAAKREEAAGEFGPVALRDDIWSRSAAPAAARRDGSAVRGVSNRVLRSGDDHRVRV